MTVNPFPLVVTEVLPFSVPLPLRLETVSVLDPSALRRVTSVTEPSKLPFPSRSTCVVVDRPLPEVVTTVLSFNDPLALRSDTVRTTLPSGFKAVTSVCDKSTAPSPVTSRWVVVERPFALVVTTILSFSDPLALKSERVAWVLPLAWTATTDVWSVCPSPFRSVVIVVVRRSALMVVICFAFRELSALKSLMVSVWLPSAPSTATSVSLAS